MFFEGKAEFRQPHAFRNLEEVYPDGQPLPRIDDSDRIEFFESQRFRTGAKKKKEKKKTPAETEALAELGRLVLQNARNLGPEKTIEEVKAELQDDQKTGRIPGAGASDKEDEEVNEEAARLEQNRIKELDEDLNAALDDIDQYEKLIKFIKTRGGTEPPSTEINDLIKRFNAEADRTANAIPESGIDAEPEIKAEDADVEVVGVSKKDPPKKQVKVKVEPEEVIAAAEPESDVDSVDEDTEEIQVLDAALSQALPKIK